MNKQINFRATKFTCVELDMLSKKLGVDKTTIIVWAINKMAEDNNINKIDIYDEMSKC